MYTTEGAARKGVQSVVKNGATADIRDSTQQPA